MNSIRVHLKPYIQPFERDLALRELASLTTSEPTRVNQSDSTVEIYEVRTATSASALARSLAYWELVEDASGAQHTAQVLRESTTNVVRNGISLEELRRALPFGDDAPLPNRRCLRYGSHGIHEYRGKFFPQLVRSLINVAGTPPRGTVGDPMSGSGTTVIEAILAGRSGRGIDMNPLSVFISKVKAQTLSSDPVRLAQHYVEVRDELLHSRRSGRRKLAYLESLPVSSRDYLENWFAPEVLGSLDQIMDTIKRVAYSPARELMLVSLSNILRSVSWQKKDDLRVRKEIRLDIEIDPKREFLEELGRSVRAVLAFLYQVPDSRSEGYRLEEGDARNCAEHWGSETIDTIITSPPYATALPYLDTDRLSLYYLNLLPRSEHRKRDLAMIGNREINEATRASYWATFCSERDLPDRVVSLIEKIESLNSNADVGFRRRNLPALLSKYFYDMRAALTGMHTALKPGGTAFMVVGNNHTVAGGKRVDIQTARLLSDIAKSGGFDVADPIEMDMLVSRDIFRKNAMATEEILILRKKP